MQDLADSTTSTVASGSDPLALTRFHSDRRAHRTRRQSAPPHAPHLLPQLAQGLRGDGRSGDRHHQRESGSTQWLRVLHDSTLSLRVPWLPKRPRTGHWDQRWASANIFATVLAQSSMQRSGQTLKGSGRTSLDGVPVGRCGGMRPGEEVPSLAGVTAVGDQGFGSQERLDGAEVPAGRRHSVRLHSAVCRYSNSSSGGALVRSFLH